MQTFSAGGIPEQHTIMLVIGMVNTGVGQFGIGIFSSKHVFKHRYPRILLRKIFNVFNLAIKINKVLLTNTFLQLKS